MIEYRQEVDGLIAAYEKYKQLLQDEAVLSSTLAKQKILGVVDETLSERRNVVQQKMRDLSDSMTFSHPFVWILYKFEAYKDEAQPIRTMRDFRIHCSKGGDICTKRFAFVNERLDRAGRRTLRDDKFYDDAMLLDALVEDDSLLKLVNDSGFMQLWKAHEFNVDNGRVAKWESYATTA